MPPARPISPAVAPLLATALLLGWPGLALGQRPPPPAEPALCQLTGMPPPGAFAPLLGDPREPQFAGAARFYQGDERFNVVGAANFGATLPLYGWEALGGGIWQVGVQAGVFSIFDLEADSMDLINADYLVGVPLTARYGPLSARARLLHVSSHLGDEFVLGGRVDERINLSYEAVDLLLSFDVARTVRLYGGGGTLVRIDPGDLNRPFAQGGVELAPPYPLLGGQLFPLAAVDVPADDETGWDPSVSVRAGIEVQSGLLTGRRLCRRWPATTYSGHSPNGQFYENRIEFWGLGLHFYF